MQETKGDLPIGSGSIGIRISVLNCASTFPETAGYTGALARP